MAPHRMVKFTFFHTWFIGLGTTYVYSYLFAFLLRTNNLYRILYVYGLHFFFKLVIFVYWFVLTSTNSFLQAAINGSFNIM